MLRIAYSLLGALIFLACLGEVKAQSQNNSQPTAKSQATQNPATKDQRGTEQSPFFVKVIPAPKTNTEKAQEAEDREEKSNADTWLIRWTGAVAVFTFVLGAISAWQGIQLKRSVDLLSQSERAQMFINIRHDGLPMVASVAKVDDEKAYDAQKAQRPIVTFTFRNYGKTPAVVKEICCRLSYFDKLPAEPTYVPIDRVLAEDMIAPGDVTGHPGLQQRENHHCVLSDPLTVEQAKSVVRAQSYIWFFGRIVYDDIFGVKHEHRFLWRYGGAHGFRPNYEYPNYIKNS